MAATVSLHRGQTSEAFFVLFSGILFNIKWKHGQGCIKSLVNVTVCSLFSNNKLLLRKIVLRDLRDFL